MLKLHQDGLTQKAIAQRLDCDQAAVCRWLEQFSDSTELAKSFLRGSALKMSQNLVNKGRPSDHAVALKGLSVLKDDAAQGVTVIVGGSGTVNVGIVLSPSQAQVQGEGEQKPQQKLTESDSRSYVNRANLLIDRE